ncbi:uncharacterized protein [Pleurodeles waltl]|uniref:uncharacterized protein n=1 Tax=Pleurodeles waltl TaxID=8319 RepID=UPI0037099794
MPEVDMERPRAPLCSDPHGARYMNSRWRYLADLGLQEQMESLCQRLLNTPRIPWNPYPGFVQQLRQQAQRICLEGSSSIWGLDRHANISLHPQVKWDIAGVGGSLQVWGLPSILSCVRPESLAPYTWLVHDVTSLLPSFQKARPYTVQVLPALTGPCIFTGTLFLTPPSVDILQVFVIIGPDVERAISLYSQCVWEDITRIINQRRHLVYRICVPVDKGGKLEIFTEMDTRTRAVELRSSVQSAARCQRQVRVECLWRMDLAGTDFLQGSKCYDLTVIQTSPRLRGERVIDFSGCQLQHLYSSLFLQRSHAEAYVGLFLPRELVENPELLPPQTPQPDSWKALGKGPQSVSDLRVPEDPGGPYSDEDLEQIRDDLLHRIATTTPLPEGALGRAHLTTLLLLLDYGKGLSQTGSAGEQELRKGIDRLGRFLGGSAAKLGAVDSLMKTLEATVAYKGEQILRQEALSVLLRKAVHWTEEVEATDATCPCGFPTLWKTLLEHVLTAVEKLSQGSTEGREDLQAAASIGQVLLAQLLEDALPWIPALLEAERRASDLEMVQRKAVVAGISKENHVHARRRGLTWEVDPGLLYSTELSVEIPSSVSVQKLEVAHCQYLVDCRLEQHWHGALEGILSQTPLPANPYPSLVTAFRKASLRMDLWGQSDEDILKRVLQIPLRSLEGQKNLFVLQGALGFGLRSAVCAPNTKLLGTALRSWGLLRNTSWEPRLGAFKVTVTSALHRPGALDHFLNSVEMTEFCSLQGPPGCQLEALQIYSRLVFTHLSDLQHRAGVVGPTVRIGASDTWSSSRAQKYPKAFMEALTESLQRGIPLCLEAWQSPESGEWRFVPLVKHLTLHHIESGRVRGVWYPEKEPLALYWAIFSSWEEAAMELPRAGFSVDLISSAALQRPLSQLTTWISQDFESGDLLSVCRHMTSRALLIGDHEALPACWRVLHSMAAQLEHLNSINATVQALLLMDEPESYEEGGIHRAPTSYRTENLALGKLISGLRLCLQRALSHSSALAPCSLWEVVERRMQAVSAGERVEDSVIALKAVQVMCRAVMETTYQDLLSLCPEIQATVHRLQTGGRPGEQLVIQRPSPAETQPGGQGRSRDAPPSLCGALDGW